MSRPELPFQVVNIDLISPVDPVSSQGHNYILCLMDQHSRWPEAIPLKSLTAKEYVERILVYTNGRQQQTSNSLRIHRGQYQWNVLPFGLRNAAATYQRAMCKVVQTIFDFTCVYIVDLAIFSDTWEEHLNHLEEVFKRLEHFNSPVNLGKCEFARQKVKYLGHVIGSGRHSPDKEKNKSDSELTGTDDQETTQKCFGIVQFL
ncbi:retrovirus-related Pol polyprotein from transposon 17.6 [Trichonephila clavipes]|nr:retrovirus-related Pol polyprotein from transposon 17.6 [Trichonephila clavipes]